jgi:hypothetical protein
MVRQRTARWFRHTTSSSAWGISGAARHAAVLIQLSPRRRQILLGQDQPERLATGQSLCGTAVSVELIELSHEGAPKGRLYLKNEVVSASRAVACAIAAEPNLSVKLVHIQDTPCVQRGSRPARATTHQTRRSGGRLPLARERTPSRRTY